MVDFVKYDMTDIWASAGDVTAPSSLKIATGWVVEAVPRQWWNWFENRQDNNIAYMLQKGIPEWDSVTEYQTNKSYVQRNNVVYKCILANTNFDPATSPTYWVKAFPESSASLEAIRVLTPVASSLAYFTGASTAAITSLTAFGRSLIAAADAAAARTLLSAQASHVNLTALSGATAATNTFPYWNSATTMLASPITAFGRSLVDDADAATARTTLGLGTAATATLTTSTLDNTVGRVTKVGDFGESGGAPLSQGSGVDANSFTISATYMFPSGGINLPAAAAYYLKHIQHSVAGYAKQFAWNMTTNTAHERLQVAGVWSAWELSVFASSLGSAAYLNASVANVANTVVQRGSGGDIAVQSVTADTVLVATGQVITQASIEVGNTVGSASTPFIDFHSSATAVDYDTRIISDTGTGVSGGGTMRYFAGGGHVFSGGLLSPTLTGTPLSTTAAPGTNTTQIATTAFVAAGLALKQNSLGFTPVQQGTGVGQLTNVVKIGWSAAAKLKLTVDSSDLGNFALEPWVTSLIQTATTDATIGRLMGVGAFGLGSNGLNLNVASNVTTTVNVGFYKFSGGATGAPPQFSGAGGSLIVHSLGGNFLQQIAISIPGSLNNPMMCIRHYDTNGTPGSWVTVCTNANIIGTVSVTGTLPTGAIIETGTTANGSYTKFTDGTLINQGPIADFAVGVNALATLTPNGTFAHPFVNSLYDCQVMGTPSGSNDQYGFTSVNNRATTAVNFVHRNGATAQNMVNVRFVAVGRWF